MKRRTFLGAVLGVLTLGLLRRERPYYWYDWSKWRKNEVCTNDPRFPKHLPFGGADTHEIWIDGEQVNVPGRYLYALQEGPDGWIKERLRDKGGNYLFTDVACSTILEKTTYGDVRYVYKG